MKSVLTNSEAFTVSEITLCYNPGYKISERPVINCAQGCYEIFLACWDLNRIGLLEEFKILMLNKANRILGIFNVSAGGMDSTIVDIRLIMTTALLCNVKKMILAHNHPSGNLKPSAADLNITNRIKDAAALFNIEVLDHLVLTADGFCSFAEEGHL